MGKPRIMLEVGYFRNTKIAELAWRRQLGHIYILMQAKQQDLEGVFGSKAVVKIEAGVFRDCVDELMQAGLLHDSTALCEKCRKAFPDVKDGSVVVHDWSEYQVSRTTAWRLDKALDETSGETPVKQPRNINGTAMEHPSRARVSRGSLVPSSETSNDGEGSGEGPVVAWLARHGCYIRPGNGYHQKLILALERHGADAMLGVLDRLAKAGTRDGDIKGLLFGAIDALDRETRPRLVDAERDAESEKRSQRRQQGIWKRRIEEYHRGGGWDSAWGEPPVSA